MTAQYVHEFVSQNFRMSELEAAWLRLTLAELTAGNETRRAIVARYRRAAPGLHWQTSQTRHAYHLAVLRSSDREATRAALNAAGVATAIHYPLAITQQPAYRDLAHATCPEAEAEAEAWAAECLSVPCFPEMTEAEIAQGCAALAGLAQ